MTSISRTACAVVVAGLAVTPTPTAAVARPGAPMARPGAPLAGITPVACGSAALAGAITAANAVPATLRLAPFCTYLLTAALPQITGNVTLVGGPSTAIKRAPSTPSIRILDVAAGGTLRVVRVFILNGSTTAAEGAGIRNAGDLVLNHTTLSGNTTVGQNGAGISNTGRALVIRSLFAGNATSGPVGNRDGGGIYNNGSLTLIGSRLSGNIAVRNGGALFTTAGHTSRVIQSTLSANTAANLGGAIYNEGTTSLRQTLVAFNQAIGTTTAGGITNAAGTVTLQQSVVRKNSPNNCEPPKSVPACTG